jgi:hypothetical protein
MAKEFKDVAVGEVFVLDGITYTKVPDERISCCKSINCVAVDNVANRKFVQPNVEVQEAQ